MSNEVLPFISNEVVELFEGFDGDYLADVLRVWDCDAQDWFDDMTAIFRFETDDLLVWCEAGTIMAVRGAVETRVFDLWDLVDDDDRCLSWRYDPMFGDLVGSTHSSRRIVRSFASTAARGNSLDLS